ncbi:hypothetical protein CH25_gp39 [Mycobacterium phage EagleEye]|uniref:Lipoprotein n=1 Tax=Mycobacterium phage EagleEye TaxID=1429759 RepID=W0LN25_9CAUD|nr:hypothetical protein CH25_gp39 [Mycobacterium phage EagleEye]AHG23847.1 hypothetical protein PBI_EAGLEEYE_67 [Mycobacterium phage EagleEye]QDK03500.1 membrane protein [Mycobacterium phage Lucyedi]QNJ55849.1 hypothetical protein SEA_PAINTERBOY_66 [Mycobacterium phage PainterBoy]
MKKVVAALLLAGAAVGLSACSSAAVESGTDRFSVKVIDGTRCIVWSPYNGSGDGSQMECDFR